jgi:hypothetical protein
MLCPHEALERYDPSCDPGEKNSLTWVVGIEALSKPLFN